MTTPAARRFYTHATALDVEGGHGVALDERRLRTPKGAIFIAPTRALAHSIAAEWDAQSENIIPSLMPLTQLAFAAIDHTANKRDEIASALAKYAETDLVSHRAETPEGLVTRQSEKWDPLIAWGHTRFGIRLPVVTGIIAAPISAELLTAFSTEISTLDIFRATAAAQAITLAGSILIGFALIEGQLSAQQAFEAATVDERWSQERWGRDEEAHARLEKQRAEFETIARFVSALG